MDDNTIQFLGSVYRVGFDREGEGTIVLKVPSSDIYQAVNLLTHLEQTLKFTVESVEA